jgi:transglutaminase-like putative cysteine protease
MQERATYDVGEYGQMAVMRAVRTVATLLRPWTGWLVLAVCVALMMLPALSMSANRWIRLSETERLLAMAGNLAVLSTWLVLGWKRPAAPHRRRWLWALAQGLLLLLSAVFVLSLLIVRWLPSPATLWLAVAGDDWTPVWAEMANAWTIIFARYRLWWQGVQAGGAAQDELVFAGFVSLLIWLVGVATAWLTRATRRGLAGAAPVVALVGAILFYGGEGRWVFMLALALALMLHLTMEHQALVARWQQMRLDYSSDIFPEMIFNAAAICTLILLAATFLPNLSISAIAARYAEIIAPVDERVESVREQIFPNLRRRIGAGLLGGAGGGLPNQFLLGGGPELQETLVMEVRTSEDSGGFLDEPPGHALRARALTIYDGLGWSNPGGPAVVQLPANTPRPGLSPTGRRQLVQSVRTFLPLHTVFAAPELSEISTDVWLETLDNGEMLNATTNQPSYSVQSLIPALDEQALLQLPDWGADIPLPAGYEPFLELPDTVTERTRQLAEELTSASGGPYARASAIESYLRTYPYDLDVAAPPATVTDVADYFLFDLQRGYCDYYATAFVVLARLAGLPTRFATGYTAGGWQSYERSWLISAANAHSWPEVFLPEVGWIAFEPTAGRPLLERTAAPQAGTLGAATPTVPETPQERTVWNWQMLFWLLPLGLLVFSAMAVVRGWRMRHEEPWPALLRWGERVGRPLQAGETVLEYGRALAEVAVERGASAPDAARIVRRDVLALSESVSRTLYAPDSESAHAKQKVAEHWQRLRLYLPKLRMK